MLIELFARQNRMAASINMKLITNTKLHMGIQLVPKVVTLSDPEPCNGRYFLSLYPEQ